MGVDTIGLLRSNTTEKGVVSYLESRFKEVESFVEKRDSYLSGFIKFKDEDDERMLYFSSYSGGNYVVGDLTIRDCTYISIGMWGNSVEIVKDMCEHFGGAIDENDCDEEEFYFVDKEKFFQDVEMTIGKELELTLNSRDLEKVTEILNKYGIKL